ncbi:hypothetical protein [Deinococcus aluminii]|uniref:Uncharacterized protein n=1 Tax=Deinococcus aluminii TaxID=1656885 RepID=A0ABP9XGZ4_9DEIO
MKHALEIEIGTLDVQGGNLRVMARTADVEGLEQATRAYEAAGGNLSARTMQDLALDDRYGLLQHGKADQPGVALTIPLEGRPRQVRVLGHYAPDGTLLGVTLDFQRSALPFDFEGQCLGCGLSNNKLNRDNLCRPCADDAAPLVIPASWEEAVADLRAEGALSVDEREAREAAMQARTLNRTVH